jgi:hypothetical protein
MYLWSLEGFQVLTYCLHSFCFAHAKIKKTHQVSVLWQIYIFLPKLTSISVSMDLFFLPCGVLVMTYTLLSDLSTKQQLWCVKVKVMRLWEFINNRIEGRMSLDMILMDEKVNLFSIFLHNSVNGIYFNLN